MTDPLFSLGAQRTREILTEALLPLVACVFTWRTARRLLGEPDVGRGLSSVELAVLLAAFVVVFSWYGGRQLSLFHQRDPKRLVAFGGGGAMVALVLLGLSVQTGFDARCRELGGQPATAGGLLGDEARVCQVGGIPGNPYLPGVLLRSAWTGALPAPAWLGLAGLAALTVLGTRDRRLRPSAMGIGFTQLLRLAPAAGSGAIHGGDASGGVQACTNPTLWGELCGQLYPAERAFEEGEWCVRCSQTYRRCDRELTLDVVSLQIADVDVLNGLERLDALAWEPGEPMPPDARLSGQERWARLGRITVPDVITVAQLLAIVHEQLGGWSKDVDEATGQAIELASARASKLAGWLWVGAVADRLTYARPTDRAQLVLGPSRLRDLMLDASEPLTLQLEIGLMPVELRTAFRKTFLDPSRPAVQQNAKQDLWVPVAPDPTPLAGVWVPRIEGVAMRRWLSLDRLRADDVQGVSSPTPYRRPDDPAPGPVRPGSLDLVRAPLDPASREPLLGPRPGDSLAEWSWMEWRQIELLRQHSLVLVAR